MKNSAWSSLRRSGKYRSLTVSWIGIERDIIINFCMDAFIEIQNFYNDRYCISYNLSRNYIDSNSAREMYSAISRQLSRHLDAEPGLKPYFPLWLYQFGEFGQFLSLYFIHAINWLKTIHRKVVQLDKIGFDRFKSDDGKRFFKCSRSRVELLNNWGNLCFDPSIGFFRTVRTFRLISRAK